MLVSYQTMLICKAVSRAIIQSVCKQMFMCFGIALKFLDSVCRVEIEFKIITRLLGNIGITLLMKNDLFPRSTKSVNMGKT